jgi:hypothetical protein
MTCTSKAASIQGKIWKGYGKTASIIGMDYTFYRPSTGYMLLEDGTKMLLEDGQALLTGGGPTFIGAELLVRSVSLNAEDMAYKKPNKYGKATWYAVVDGNGLKVGDYFIGTEGTFFIAAMQLMLPILVVECNRTISLFRPQLQSGKGAQPYSGMTTQNEKPIVQGVPCSILQGTKGEKSEVALPGDTRSPWWTLLVPASVGRIKIDDLLIDDLGQRYVVSSPELTDLGYRLTCMMAMA